MLKIVNELIDFSIKGVDVYRWKNATWLIFTNETRWVVELTDEGTLWYNYKFFKDIFKYVSISVGQEMDGYIIQWANDFFYKDCAHRTAAYPRDKGRNETPKVLENGIKNISKSSRTLGEDYIGKVVEGGIKNIDHSVSNLTVDAINFGIKKIGQHGKNHGDEFEWHTRAVIGNGVKEVEGLNSNAEFNVRNVMNYGVKEGIKEVGMDTMFVEYNDGQVRQYHNPNCPITDSKVEDVVKEGIKEVYDSSSTHRQMRAANEMVKMIKEIKPNRVIIHNEKMDRFYYDPTCTANFTILTDIIEEGVKKVKPNIEYSKQSGVYHPDCVANHIKIDKVIEEGVKEVKPSKLISKRGIHIDDLMCSGNTTDIKHIIKKGVKNIYPDMIPNDYDWSDEFNPDKVIEGGIKVIPLPTKEGVNGYSDYYDAKGWDGKSHTDNVKDAIEGGTKL